MSEASSAASVDEAPRYRMQDLRRLTGLSRQAIHFYIREGLVPEGHKTGRNMAYYGPAHLERLQLVRRLQHERMLPLKAIKAILGHTVGSFDAPQRQMLTELKSRLSSTLGTEAESVLVDAAALCERLRVGMDDVRRMAELGVVGLDETAPGAPRIGADSVWVLELWSQLRALGFTEQLGFTVEDLAMYEDVISTLFRRETKLVLERLADQPTEQVASMVEGALPLIHTFLAHYHTTQVRNFFAALE